jgi:small-conductance mechanosensitive channel
VVVETWDGKIVHLPNTEVLANPMVNDTHSGTRRSEIEVRVESTDVQGTCDRLLALVASAPGVVGHPAPMVFVTAVDPERVTTLVQFWHQPSNANAVTSAVIKAVAAGTEGAMTAIAPRPMAPFTPPPKV